MYEGKDKSFYICEYEHADLILIPEIFEHDRVTGGGENANVTEIFRDSGTIWKLWQKHLACGWQQVSPLMPSSIWRGN